MFEKLKTYLKTLVRIFLGVVLDAMSDSLHGKAQPRKRLIYVDDPKPRRVYSAMTEMDRPQYASYRPVAVRREDYDEVTDLLRKKGFLA